MDGQPDRAHTRAYVRSMNDTMDDEMSVRSFRSHRSTSSRASSTSSTARREALVEAATAKKSLEFERILVDKQKEQDDKQTEMAAKQKEMADKRKEVEMEMAAKQKEMADKRKEVEMEMAAKQKEMADKQKEVEMEMERNKRETEREMVIIAATKAAAVAQAKLQAIDQAIEEENGGYVESPNLNNRTDDWVDSQNHGGDEDLIDLRGHNNEMHSNGSASTSTQKTTSKVELIRPDKRQVYTHEDLGDFRSHNNEMYSNGSASTSTQQITTKDGPTRPDKRQVYTLEQNDDCFMRPSAPEFVPDQRPATDFVPDRQPRENDTPKQSSGRFAGNAPAYQPTYISPHSASDNVPTSLEVMNNQLMATLARQNLPKFESDIFDGKDVTLYLPWKNSFQSMLENTNISPNQEVIYLRKFTSGCAQDLVDSFRKRIYTNPNNALKDIWHALDKRFGNSAGITQSYLQLLDKSAKFSESDNERLRKFSDVCSDIRNQVPLLPALECLNYANVLQPVIDKLPKSIQHKWEKIVVEYASRHDDAYPKFQEFADLVVAQSELRNHPNLQITRSTKSSKATALEEENSHNFHEEHSVQNSMNNRVLKSSANSSSGGPREPNERHEKYCPYHDADGHNLLECDDFAKETMENKTECVRYAGLCYRCLTRYHRSTDCRAQVKCEKCDSKRHNTLFHFESKTTGNTERVKTTCTTVCKGDFGGVSCSKIILVDVFHKNEPCNVRRLYAIIDDQSNTSLVSPQLIDGLGLDCEQEQYLLSTCAGQSESRVGRRVSDLVVRGVNGESTHLPSLLECDCIPNDKREIPTQEIALRKISGKLPPLDNKAEIEMLIGRNAPELLKVRSSINGPAGSPWAQELHLGWTISGQVCLDRVGGAIHVKAHKTCASSVQEPDYNISPCTNQFNVKCMNDDTNIFTLQQDDNDIAMSQDDRIFIDIMQKNFHKNHLGNCEMPLPFRSDDTEMPNNREQALKRLESLRRSFMKNPTMQDHYVDFMKKTFERGHAAVIPFDNAPPEPGHVWYLPHFGVYNQKKPNQIRVVFDSAAEHKGVSLNKVLIPGPDQLNNLVGVLVRFRMEDVALTCDIEQMFHSFYVDPTHRDYLRFLWFEANDPTKDIVECQMNVHLFGNCSSPAVATYGMRRTADEGAQEYGTDAKEFIRYNFYVDDGLISVPTPDEAISLLRRTQALLATTNLRLHKVASNSLEVMNALPKDDRAKDFHDLDLRHDTLPSVRSLGVVWKLADDTFTYNVALQDKPYTRRGILAVVNSIYDPLGFAAPAIIKGKIIMQELTTPESKEPGSRVEWDEPLPTNTLHRWQAWKKDLLDLKDVNIPRCYHSKDFGKPQKTEIHAFSDASKDAIGVAVYVRIWNEVGAASVRLLFGQAKVAPRRTTTIPRLELCAAVMATQAVAKLTKETDLHADEVLYSDSKIVLGYIRNDSRRFYVYVANRVQQIRNSTNPSQWRYVDTSNNPADVASRGIPSSQLMASIWLTGPEFLHSVLDVPNTAIDIDDILDVNDPDTRPQDSVTVNDTIVRKPQTLGSDRFKRFSTWKSARRAIASLIGIVKRFKERRDNVTTNTNSSDCTKERPPWQTTDELKQAERVIILSAQKECFDADIKLLSTTAPITIDGHAHGNNRMKQSRLHRLDPFIDENNTLRIGGRLRRSSLDFPEKHPVILPRRHHITDLIVRHYHDAVHHQGRVITLGAVRQAGYWVVGGQGLVSQIINPCVSCRRLRGATATQHMANLPPDRLEPAPPFTNVGVDVFGPWEIHTKKLRGGSLQSKRWGLVFTCLASRAIHIELLESMDASSYICALRRFFSIRGPASIIRCDNGTNFVGARSELNYTLSKEDNTKVGRYTTQHGCEWLFNPPHASHFGGVWERQIHTIRRVLDGMFLELGHDQLTHELLVTLMAEVSAIVNARPIAATSVDSDEPQPLTPTMLLTMKTRPLLPPSDQFIPQDLYVKQRWRRSQYLADQFWVRWKREYVQNLQPRSKWCEKQRDLAIGDIVLLKDDNSPRYRWNLGRISEVVPSDDNMIRTVVISFWKDGVAKAYTRPISQVVLLIPHDE